MISTMQRQAAQIAQLYRDRAVAWACVAVVIGYAAYKFFRGLQCLAG